MNGTCIEIKLKSILGYGLDSSGVWWEPVGEPVEGCYEYGNQASNLI
jgi:hypothetical protein